MVLVVHHVVRVQQACTTMEGDPTFHRLEIDIFFVSLTSSLQSLNSINIFTYLQFPELPDMSCWEGIFRWGVCLYCPCEALR